jgi:hypothetical protein
MLELMELTLDPRVLTSLEIVPTLVVRPPTAELIVPTFVFTVPSVVLIVPSEELIELRLDCIELSSVLTEPRLELPAVADAFTLTSNAV